MPMPQFVEKVVGIYPMCSISYLKIRSSLAYLHCLSRSFGEATCAQNYRTSTVIIDYFSYFISKNRCYGYNSKEPSMRHFYGASKVSKKAKIRNQYNQVPHLTQDTTLESDKTQENITYKTAKAYI